MFIYQYTVRTERGNVNWFATVADPPGQSVRVGVSYDLCLNFLLAPSVEELGDLIGQFYDVRPKSLDTATTKGSTSRGRMSLGFNHTSKLNRISTSQGTKSPFSYHLPQCMRPPSDSDGVINIHIQAA